MHWYKKNLGDYAKKAGKLSLLQHGVYTVLLDACYDREKFPTRQQAIDWTWASTEAEIQALDFVLNKFFVLENDVYVQTRVKEEIEAYHETSTINKRIAHERETKRKEKSTNRTRSVNEACTNGERVVNEPPPNQEPITINQEPIKKIYKKNSVEDFFTEFDELWRSLLPECSVGPIFEVERAAQLLLVKKSRDEILNAIRNYAHVLKSEKHYYTHKTTLAKFLTKHVFDFCDAMKPLENFLIAEKSAAKNSEANEVWENVLNLAGRAYSQKTYESLPKRIKVALKSIGGLSALGLMPKSNLISVKSIFLEAYTQAGES